MQRRARFSVESSNQAMNSPVQNAPQQDTYPINEPQEQENLVVEVMEESQNFDHQATTEYQAFTPIDVEAPISFTPQDEPDTLLLPQDNSFGHQNNQGNSLGNRNNQGGFNNASHSTNSSSAPTSFLGGLLGQNGGGFSAQSIKDVVEGLKNNFGETVSSTFSSVSSPITSIMDKIGIDADKLLIMGIILILLNEKGDKTLLLALGYLLIT